jgi:hypothetical protein
MRPIQPWLLLLLLAFPLIPTRSGLPADRKFGKPDPESLAMTVYPADTSAPAVKLFDAAEMHVFASGQVGLEIKRHFRIKILKPAGLSTADVVIPFWHEDRVFGVDAVSVSPSGRKTKLQDKSIHEVIEGERFKQKTFAVPGAEVGSVIDVRYELFSKNVLHLDPWVFQDDIPVRESEVRLIIDPGYMYNVVIRNDVNRLVSKTDEPYLDPAHPGHQLTRYLYRAEALPAVKDEPYVACLADHRARADFQIMGFRDVDVNFTFIKDLKTLCRELCDGRFGGFFEPSGRVREAVRERVRPDDTDAEKIRRLYEEARDGYEDDPVADGLYPGRDQDDILDRRRVTVSERNLLLLSMLRAAGLDARAVLISTRGHGRVYSDVPLLSQYNRVAVGVLTGARIRLLDAGHRYLPFGLIPREDLSEEGLIVMKDDYEVISIPNAGLNRSTETETRIRAAGADDGVKWTGKGRWTGTGYASERINRGLDGKNLRVWLEDEYSGDTGGFRVTSVDSLRKPAAVDTFRADFDFEIDPPGEALGGEWAVQAFPFTGMRSNPFRSEKREFPVEFGFRSSESERTVYEFPAGTTLVSSPADKFVGNTDASVTRRFSVLGTSPLTVSCSRVFTIQSPSVPESRYSALRELFGRIMDADREPVVVRFSAGAGN